eukprot:360150-Chlamydomonas_euryale.AAC.2
MKIPDGCPRWFPVAGFSDLQRGHRCHACRHARPDARLVTDRRQSARVQRHEPPHKKRMLDRGGERRAQA